MFLSKDELQKIGFKTFGNNVLISNKCCIYSPQNIEIGNNVSGRVSIYSSSDDYTGMSMTNPMIPNEFKKVTNGKIHIKKHSIIGTGSVLLPNVNIGIGCSIYAQTLIKSNCKDFGIYSGNPSKLLGKRLKKFLDYEKKFIGVD